MSLVEVYSGESVCLSVKPGLHTLSTVTVKASHDAIVFQVPLPLLDVYGLHRLFTQSHEPHSVRFQGICTSMSTVSKQVGTVLCSASPAHCQTTHREWAQNMHIYVCAIGVTFGSCKFSCVYATCGTALVRLRALTYKGMSIQRLAASS